MFARVFLCVIAVHVATPCFAVCDCMRTFVWFHFLLCAIASSVSTFFLIVLCFHSDFQAVFCAWLYVHSRVCDTDHDVRVCVPSRTFCACLLSLPVFVLVLLPRCAISLPSFCCSPLPVCVCRLSSDSMCDCVCMCGFACSTSAQLLGVLSGPATFSFSHFPYPFRVFYFPSPCSRVECYSVP